MLFSLITCMSLFHIFIDIAKMAEQVFMYCRFLNWRHCRTASDSLIIFHAQSELDHVKNLMLDNFMVYNVRGKFSSSLYHYLCK